MSNYGIKDIKGNDNNVVLKKAAISGNICGEFVEVTINQIFENRSDKSIEVVYSFPIPYTAVISEFEATVGGRTMRAVVEDKSKAVKIYEEAEERGENIFLLEEFKPHEFQITIGKVIPKESIKIKLSYIDDLEYRNGTYKLVIPALASPQKLGDENEMDDNDYNLTLSLLVESLCKLKFSSPFYNIGIEREGINLSKISYKDNKTYMEKDFVLIMREEEQSETSGMIYEYKDKGEKRGIVYLRLVPKLEIDTEEKPENYIFLIDITESMNGAKLEEAKNALQLCIRNLSDGDAFDIVAMGEELRFFSKDGKLPFNEENLENASDWIDGLQAKGDTLIYNAIKYALENSGEDNTILLFTDDMVVTENDILDYVKDHIGNNRIFTFGIDSIVNTYFIDKLARLGHGKAEFIYEGERIEECVLRQFTRIENPEVNDLSIDWGKLKLEETFPKTITYMYDREPFSVFGSSLGEFEGEIFIKGKVGNLDYNKKVNLDNFELEENANLIQKVWARKRIQSLEERMLGERGEIKEDMRQKVIEISKKSGIISPETSFIVVEEREEPVLGIQLKNIIPLKVYEKNLSDKAITENLKEHFSEFPSFLYKTYTEDYLGRENQFLDYKYPIEKILLILAKNQYADGSFAKFNEKNLKNKIETTSLTILAFSLGADDIKIYVNQLNKSVDFLIRYIDSEEVKADEKLHSLVELALRSCLRKGFLKGKVLEKTIERFKDREVRSIKKQVISIFTKSKDGNGIEETFVIKNDKDSIIELAKLGILKGL
ncbi:MAG: VWA domain-containing protein [Clostridiaceae bacterium]|nr:VWA domain-containing protein [Clostridiaceae bacterium]